jgi:Asp-tRNA(Asn)/Glu-tRNA(Gln) amidotransferase A subunit family amidase
MTALNTLTATELAKKIASGAATAQAIVRDHLERIAKRDAEVLAWSHLAREAALEQARLLDRGPRQGLLHGIPMGVKDIIDSVDQPTTYGSPIYQTHRPLADAATVALAKSEGAILLGKTVTTEFANRHPGPTRNPHNPAHTPGGSSSGSAAAIADFQVVLATGTQTGGSVIRPAAYCGVVGYKPTYGHFAPAGMKANTEWLDTIGTYARSVEDIGLFRAALMAVPYTPVPRLDRPPRLAVCFTPHRAELSREGEAAVQDAANQLRKAGAVISELDLPEPVSEMTEGQRVLSAFDGPRAHADEARRFPHLLSDSLKEHKLAAGAKIDYAAWIAARRLGEKGRARVDALFSDLDAILTAPAPGEAPPGLASTGKATFNLLWTYLWMPCITLPFARGPSGLPVGIQLVGRQHEDSALLSIAAWVRSALS